MKAQDFKDRKQHDKTPEMDNAPWVKIPSGELDDPKYNWIQVGHTKYGRYMYCTKTHVRRGQTMGEFYGSGVVD